MTDVLRACFWMTGAIVSFTVMAVAGREVSLDLDTYEIMLYRSLIGVVVVVSVAGAFGRLRDITRRSMSAHFARNISHFAGQNLWFYSITVVPLAQVFALEFTMPFWAMVLSAVVLGERLTGNRVAAAVVGFIGILIVTRPTAEGLALGQLTAALAAVGFAGSAVFTRLLTRTEKITCILFWLTVMQAVFGLVCAGFDGDIALPGPETWPWVVAIAMAGLVAHFCITMALSLASASIVMPIDFGRLPVIALVGMAFYAEPLDIFVLIGAVVIFAANYANIRYETRKG